MIEIIRDISAFVVALGILVAVHEWGHFWVARRCGVKVERFSIGFGKALWSRTDKKGTEYVIAAIPLGGYVKMLDERVEQVKQDELHMAFNRQNVWKRIAIIAAGPGVNFLFAIFALFVMYMIGVNSVKPVIANAQPDSIFAQVNSDSDLIINSVNGHETPDWNAVNLEVISAIGEQTLQINVTNPNGVNRTLNLDISNWKFDPDKESGLQSLGIVPFRPAITNQVGKVVESSAGEQAGLLENDIIVQFNGTTVQNWEQTVEFIEPRAAQEVTIGVLRDGEKVQLTAVLGSTVRNNRTIGLLGIYPYQSPWPEEYVFEQRYGPIDALIAGTKKTWRLMEVSVAMIGKLLTGDVSVKNLSGPISIAQGAGASASYGIVTFLSFLALISVNLGIINLLPLPVLDGGHLLYYFVELLTGKPVSESVQEVGFKIGGVALLLLMTVAIFNDIARL